MSLLVSMQAQAFRRAFVFAGSARGRRPAGCDISSLKSFSNFSNMFLMRHARPQSMLCNVHRNMHSISKEELEESQNKVAKKAKKDKAAPKRALSAYVLFGSETRDILKKENPDLSPTDIMKELGVRWKAMSAQDKAPYEDKAAEDKARHKEEMAAYEEKKAAAGEDSGSESDAPTKKKSMKTRKGKDAPKRAKSAYIFFSADGRRIIKEENLDLSSKDIMRELGARWKAMSAQEKAPYEEQAAVDMARYKEEMAAYEKK